MKKRTVEEYFDDHKQEKVCQDIGIIRETMQAIFSPKGLTLFQLTQIDLYFLVKQYAVDTENLARIVLKILFPTDALIAVNSKRQVDVQHTVKAIDSAIMHLPLGLLPPGLSYEIVAGPKPFAAVGSIGVYVALIRRNNRQVAQICKDLNFNFSTLGGRSTPFTERVWALVAHFETLNRIAELQALAIPKMF